MTLFFPAHLRTWLLGAAFCLTGLLGISAAQAAPLLDRIKDRLTPTRPPVESIKDLTYGSHKAQRFDVYHPEDAEDAPVIFMVHGGGWANGDKDNGSVALNKALRWVPQGEGAANPDPAAGLYIQSRDGSVVQANSSEWVGGGWGGGGARIGWGCKPRFS